jgi:hypothetical protein
VEIIIDGTDYDKLIDNAIKSRKIIKVTKKSQSVLDKDKSQSKDDKGEEVSEVPKPENKDLYEGNTPAGIPLLFSCINNEPKDQSIPWLLE